MSRNFLYILVLLLAIGIAVVGYFYYQESQSGVSIQIGEHGVKIDGN